MEQIFAQILVLERYFFDLTLSDFQTGLQRYTPRWPLSSKLHNWGQSIAFEYWTIRSAIFGSTYSNFLSSSSKSSLTLALKRLALPLKELSKCNSTSASQGYQQRHGLCTLEGRRKQEAGGAIALPPSQILAGILRKTSSDPGLLFASLLIFRIFLRSCCV